jgi:ABC-type Na+ efflux pump permease subunit
MRKEWANFLGSERGVFAIYGILVLSWSFIPLSGGMAAGPAWWLFFSVIICGNFTNSVFVSERLSGAMEILLTSGFTRNAVLFGKTAFIASMSIIVGIVCMGLSMVWLEFSARPRESIFQDFYSSVGLYCAGVVMNVACGAWLSVRLHSPRIIPFITIIIMTLIVTAFYCLVYFLSAPRWLLVIILPAFSVIFMYSAKNEFNGEKIIQPIDL